MYKTTPWQYDMKEQYQLFWKGYESRIFFVSCCVSLTHQGFALVLNGMITCQRSEIKALQESREIGWSVPHSRNCSCRTPLDTRTALCINLTHVRWQEFQQGATGLIGNPAVLVQLICLKVQYITTSHYMNSYLMGFTQFMLLNLRTNGMSQQISASNDAENLRLDRTEKVDAIFVLLPMQPAGIR